jgi:hypothetical protein
VVAAYWVTVIVPDMAEPWIVQKYLTVPGAVNVCVYVSPCMSVPESNVAPDVAVTVWDWVPVTVHWTGVPTATVMDAGLNFSVSSAVTAIAVAVGEVDGVTDELAGGDCSAPPLSLPLHATPTAASRMIVKSNLDLS